MEGVEKGVIEEYMEITRVKLLGVGMFCGDRFKGVSRGIRGDILISWGGGFINSLLQLSLALHLNDRLLFDIHINPLA
jgi:hypothetical protein